MTLTDNPTMQELLDASPGAKRDLFQQIMGEQGRDAGHPRPHRHPSTQKVTIKLLS